MVPQELLATAKGPVMAMLAMATAELPLLPACTWKRPEVVPTSTGGDEELWPGEGSNPMLEGLSVTTPAATPVPLNATVSCPPETLASIVIWPVRLPVAAGVNVT